jgi:hypothetical protein
MYLPRFDSFGFLIDGLSAVRRLIIQACDLRLTQSVHVSEALVRISRGS